MTYSAPLSAQVGNEWIDFDQQYWKIPVSKQGIYRLGHDDLIDAGVPSSVEAAELKLYHRGVEQAIFVSDGADGLLDPGDFIEFFGRGNDGVSDSSLYPSPDAQPHQYYNLFSDTTCYFLTLGSGAGKRMAVADPGDAGLPASTHYWDEKLLVLHESYSAGRNYGDILLSAFDTGEGWMGHQIIQNQTADYVLPDITQSFQAAGVPTLEVLLVGRGPMTHSVEVRANGRLLSTAGFGGFDAYHFQQDLQWTDIVDNALNVSVTVAGSPDRVSVGYVRVRYPRTWDMELRNEATFYPAETTGTIRAEIQNAPAGTRLYDVTDPASVVRLTAEQTTSLVATIPVNGQRTLYASSVVLEPEIAAVTFRRLNPSGQNFVIITHPDVRRPSMGYTDPVKAYAEYRSFPAGGGFDTLIVNIDQLYDQFNYGEQSPLAIFRFMRFLAAGTLPDYLFLVGKGLDVNYGFHRQPEAFDLHKNLVPSAGYPGSDHLYSAGLSGIADAPAVATGRLSASTSQDVASYLNKVKEFEAFGFDALWKKNILHLSGGIFEGEPELFRTYLADFATVAEADHLGAKVTAIAKQSTEIGVINVADQVNSGVNLITFFGHSAATTTDFDIGNVTDPTMGYHNEGRYPLLFMNGCSSGSVFLNASIFGENWVNAPDRGAIGVIAHSALGFVSRLRDYAGLFYNHGIGDPEFVNSSIGEIQKNIGTLYLNENGHSAGSVTQVQQMVLLGDPAVRLFAADKPDYHVEKDFVSITSFNGEAITARADSFRINVVVKNFGITSAQPFRVEVARELSDQSVHLYDSVYSAVRYADTLSLIIPRVDNSYGNNRFTVRVDADNTTDELHEDNNEATVEFFVPLSGTRNLYPDNYAIVAESQINLTFQHTDPLAPDSEYEVELDTTDTFDSPILQQFTLAGGTLVSQQVELPGGDTLALYWRTKLVDPAGEDSIVWDTNTFTYIANGADGWAQVHFPQFSDNDLEGLVGDPVLRTHRYHEVKTSIDVRTFGADLGYPPDSTRFRINGAEYNIYTDFGCRNNTLNLIAFNKETTHAYPGIYLTWQDINLKYGGRRLICGREPYVINSFRADELAMGNDGDVIRYIDNIPAGDSVLLFNLGDAGFSQWPAPAVAKMGEIGISAAQVAALADGQAIIILARKGAPAGSARVLTSPSSPVSLKGTITGRESSGSMTSVIVGPATSWKRFYADYDLADANDVVRFHIDGLTPEGNEPVRLLSDITGDTDLTSIDAQQYPRLRLHFESSDEALLTAPHLSHWLVTFDPVAEGVLLYEGDLAPQSLSEGESWKGEYLFVNVGRRAFADSVRVDYEIVNPTTFAVTQRQMKIRGPAAGDTTQFPVSFNTIGHEGVNNLRVFANPGILAERDYNNNVIVLNNHLTVLPDRVSPVLDVTIDGRHIINGDYVSPSPEVRVLVWDNNPYFLKSDTTGVALFWSAPCGDGPCPFERINFSREEVSWSAETADREFSVTFKPDALAEGEHTLRVEAADANGNASGEAPYEITFRVQHETEVFLSRAYPNPSANIVKFDLVVAGEALPSSLNLRIIDRAGNVVVEQPMEVEGLRVGTNVIRWDGGDAAGRALPGGIYFYEIATSVGGRFYSDRGRIVLIR